MSWTSWGSSGDSSGDDSWWGYALAAASAYADSEAQKDSKKKDYKQELALLQKKFDLGEEAYARRLAERNASLAPYEKYATEQQGLPLETLSSFGQPKKGLLTYGG